MPFNQNETRKNFKVYVDNVYNKILLFIRKKETCFWVSSRISYHFLTPVLHGSHLSPLCYLSEIYYVIDLATQLYTHFYTIAF